MYDVCQVKRWAEFGKQMKRLTDKNPFKIHFFIDKPFKDCVYEIIRTVGQKIYIILLN